MVNKEKLRLLLAPDGRQKCRSPRGGWPPLRSEERKVTPTTDGHHRREAARLLTAGIGEQKGVRRAALGLRTRKHTRAGLFILQATLGIC